MHTSAHILSSCMRTPLWLCFMRINRTDGQPAQPLRGRQWRMNRENHLFRSGTGGHWTTPLYLSLCAPHHGYDTYPVSSLPQPPKGPQAFFFIGFLGFVFQDMRVFLIFFSFPCAFHILNSFPWFFYLPTFYPATTSPFTHTHKHKHTLSHLTPTLFHLIT